MLPSGFARCVSVLVFVGALACNGDGGSDGSGSTGNSPGGGAGSGGAGSTREPVPSDCEWRKVEGRRDEGCLGTDLTCTVFLYDDDGHEIGTRRDSRCDGTVTGDSYCETHEFDDMGRKVASQAAQLCDDTPTECREFSYAADGEVTERIDFGCDGVGFVCWRYRNDSYGNDLTWESDQDCDDTPESCRSGSYDAQGRPLMREYDHDCDGTPENCTSFKYNADLTKARLASDDGCDGMPEDCYEHTFDDEGRLIHDVGFVSCSDDTASSCTDFLHDKNGNYTGTEFDANCDGTPDNCAYTSWECSP